MSERFATSGVAVAGFTDAAHARTGSIRAGIGPTLESGGFCRVRRGYFVASRMALTTESPFSSVKSLHTLLVAS